jgi:hypothetical protein
MKKIGISSFILLIFIFMLAGCGDNNTPTTTDSQSTSTTSVTQTVEIEKEYELSGNETKGLLALYELEVINRNKEITISATLSSLRISRPDVFVVGEFYNAAGEMVYTNDSDYVLDSSQTIRSIGVGITYYTDDPSAVTRCKLIISAHE